MVRSSGETYEYMGDIAREEIENEINQAWWTTSVVTGRVIGIETLVPLPTSCLADGVFIVTVSVI